MIVTSNKIRPRAGTKQPLHSKLQRLRWAFNRNRHELARKIWALLHWCSDCGNRKATLCPSATAYHWDGKGENPNQPSWMCGRCAKDYYAFWDEQWREYYSGLL